MVADLPTAYVLAMSYRNFARGTDGSIYHARREFRYARSRRRLRAGARPAVRRRATSEDHLPRPPPPHLQQAAYQIAHAFRDYPQCRGLSIDDLDSYMAARE